MPGLTAETEANGMSDMDPRTAAGDGGCATVTRLASPVSGQPPIARP